MREETLERLRDGYDTTKLVVAVDELLKLQGIVMAVINERHPLSMDGEKGLLELEREIESVVGEINDAADKILEAVGELIRLCPDKEELDDED